MGTITFIEISSFLIIFPTKYYFTELNTTNVMLLILIKSIQSYLAIRGDCYFLIFICVGNAYCQTSNSLFKTINDNLPANLQNSISLYRVLTLINTLFNKTFGRVFLPITKTGVEFLQPILAYLTIRLYKNILTNPILAILPFFAINCMIYVFGFALILSGTYNNSTSFLCKYNNLVLQWNAGSIVKERKILKAYGKSCKVLRNQVGSLYYVDRFLTLSVLSFTIDSLMFMLINY